MAAWLQGAIAIKGSIKLSLALKTWLTFILVFCALAVRSQSLVLVNSGTNSGGSSIKSGSQTVFFSIGNASTVVPLRHDAQLVHHGFEYPVLLKKGVRNSLIFRAAPNPTQGSIRLIAEGFDQTSATLLIYDVTGRALLSRPFTDVLDLSVYANGLYQLVLCIDGQAQTTIPLIVSK